MSSARSRLRTTSSRGLRSSGGEREPAVAHHHAGDAVPAGRHAEVVPEELGVHVAVGVDETGRDDEPGGVDLRSAPDVDLADRDDAVAGDGDVPL